MLYIYHDIIIIYGTIIITIFMFWCLVMAKQFCKEQRLISVKSDWFVNVTSHIVYKFDTI